MNEERKNAVGVKFLLNGRVSLEECRELEIQELIFLIHSAKHFRQQQTLTGQDADEKIQTFFTVLKDKVKDAEALYLAYDKHTNYPYVDIDDRVWMFSQEEYAAGAEDYFRQQLLMFEMKKIGREEIAGAFAELHTLGLSKVLLDNGQYHIEIGRDDILPPPDWTGIPEINIPVTNPRLQHALIRFFQTLHSRQGGEANKQLLHALEGQMLDEVLQAKYLLPMQLMEKEPAPSDEQGIKTIGEGTEIRFGVLGGENDSTWLPAFTDWPEFEKVYDKTAWQSNVVAFGDLLALSENMNGIVVNCAGIPLRIDENNRNVIEAYLRERSQAEAGGVQQVVVEKDTSVLLGEPKHYPTDMIDAVKSYMKTQKSINAAYLRLMVKEREQSYLIIVDGEGSQEELFQGIAAAASPHLNGMMLNMMDKDGWEKEIRDLEPFYKRKRFGLF